MPKSQFGVKVGQGVSRSARERQCPACGRNGALSEVREENRRGVICRWARDSGGRLCSWPGEFTAASGVYPGGCTG